eukprot:Skav205012  [mRNA]  locus=scaffold2134:97300:99074:- [translate_table: standard]
MVALKLEHSNLAKHQASIFKRLRRFRKEGLLCDIVVKSHEGTEHQVHTSVLCAASEDFQNMLAGPFREATQVQQAQPPVEMAASDAVVLALLEYIYGDEPQVELEDSFELLRLAGAYNFPELEAAIKASLCASLESASVTTALKVLQQTESLHEFKTACEAKVAANFETCIEHVDFLELSAGQLGRILRRADLKVYHEEVVVQGLFNWFNRSKDRGVYMTLLLQNVDFQSLSLKNLARLWHFSASMGPIGQDLQRDVGEALRSREKPQAAGSQGVQPKRCCLKHWSADLGASCQAPRKVLPLGYSMCSHDGAIYCANGSSILRWKPGDTEGQAVAGKDARVNGANDLGTECVVSVSPEGDILVVDSSNSRLVKFRNGTGNVVLSDVNGILPLFCSPNGATYVLTGAGDTVSKLVGATLQPLIVSEHLPAELRFGACDLFVTKDEVIYLSDCVNGRVLRLNPGEAEPVVVGEVPNKESSKLSGLAGLFVTEEEKIYVADWRQRKVWSFHPGDTTWTEVLTCPGVLKPWDVLVQERSLYVNMVKVPGADAGDAEGIYEYVLPPELQLE